MKDHDLNEPKIMCVYLNLLLLPVDMTDAACMRKMGIIVIMNLDFST